MVIKGLIVKRWIILLLLCLPAAAYANPAVFNPIDTTAYLLVVGLASLVEAGMIALVLMFWGTEPMPVYMIFIAGNVILYFAVFVPLLDATSSVWLSEAVIVGLDGMLIKMVTFFDSVRADTFRPLKWAYAFVIAAAGNILSYYIGTVISG